MIYFRKLTLLLVFFIFLHSVSGQENSVEHHLKNISCAEKRWAMLHPFAVRKAIQVSKMVLSVNDSMKTAHALDGDASGGQLDAFRHAFWMALLTMEIGYRKALRLGIAHEKGNYRDYKKRRKEDGIIPDKASGKMDLFNNKVGSEIGKTNPGKSMQEIQKIIIEAILKGRMKIISKDNQGNFLDSAGYVINEESMKGKWDNGKCLVSSDNTKVKFNIVR